MDFTRRKTLIAAGVTVGLAGCTGGLPGTGTDDPNDSDDGDDGGNGGDSDDGLEYDVFPLIQSLDRPLWTMDDSATGFVTRIDSEDDLWMVEDPGEVDGLESWLAETDFGTSRVVYVETAGPNTCYGKVAVDDVTVEDGTLVGSAEAVDISRENEDCGSAETYPSAFVRVTGDDLPADTRFTITDGWGESGDVAADGLLVDPEKLPGHVRPSGDPGKLEEFTCDDPDFERHWAPEGNVALGEAHNDEDLTFAMRVHDTQTLGAGSEGTDEGTGSDGGDDPRVGRGDEVRVTMWNVSEDVQYTGNRHKYNLQVLTMDGWQDVRGTSGDGSLGYTDEAIEHRPGEGFEWTFEMTEEGVLEGHVHEDKLEVCPDLQSGRYRFLHQEAGGEPLAVEFDYVD